MISRMVIFGATGDLTARLLLPAVAQLVESEALPADIQIVGSAVEPWSVDKFREHIAQALDAHAAQVSQSTQQTVVSMLDYRPSDVTDPSDVSAVIGSGSWPNARLSCLAFRSVGGSTNCAGRRRSGERGCSRYRETLRY